MDTSKLMVSVKAFLKYFTSNASAVKSLLKRLENSIYVIHEQLITISAINECQLPASVVEKHLSLKERVTNCVSSLVDDEIEEINRLLLLLEELANNLNKLYEKIEQNMLRLKWEDIPVFYMSAFTEVVNWSEKCSKYLRLIYCNVTNAVHSFHLDSSCSSKWFKNVCNFPTENDYIIYNHPVTDMFSLFEKQILAD